MSELKPCPFCGGEAYFQEKYHVFQDIEIGCSDCTASGPLFNEYGDNDDALEKNRANAIKHWNTRVTEVRE